MATTITNQARLQFTYGATTATASSNIASTVMRGPLTADKSALEPAYTATSNLTYIVSLTNSGTAALTNVTVTDDLGTYAVSPTVSATPLYYNDPAQLYINGVYNSNLTPTAVLNGIEFTIPALAAGANAMLIYKAGVTSEALLAVGSAITNTVTIVATGLTETLTATETIPVAEYADVSIMKAMTPNPVTDGDVLTSTFTISNYGNTAATEVTLSDAFSPAPDPITVTVNGEFVAAGEYTYVGGLLTYPGAGATPTLTIPAATFTQNPANGEVAVNPGTVTIVVAGTL